LKKISHTLIKLLASPNIASKRNIYRQYDHQVGNNTVVLPGSDAAILRIKGSTKAISLTTDGNGRYCYLNPYVGGVIAVAEAARNLACSGARPLAITDCLNLGNPEKNDVYYQLKECVAGMARACKELKTPVVSGNVSLYNETRNEAIYPTPVVGMVGLIEDVNRHCTSGFKNEGDIVFLLGSPKADDSSLSGSEYLKIVHNLVMGNLFIDLELEKRLHQCCIELIRQGVINSAHDCSEGGLLVCLAESCLASGIGFVSQSWRTEGRLDTALFGEAQSRIIVSVTPNLVTKLEKIASKWQMPVTRLGAVGGKRLMIKDYVNVTLEKMEKAWLNTLGI
jgi:phosphoribosylformylglycinamidine synthase II